MKLWAGRFANSTHNLVDEYNASIVFDYQLYHFDIQGSLAHVKMLGACNILDEKTVEIIISGLKKIRFNPSEVTSSDEDIHTHIEKLLYQLIGGEANKLHTGRSRNDQVALDMHLYVRHHILHVVSLLNHINQILVDLAIENIDTLMPGYTHLQRAQPIRFSHHILAYFNMFNRDIQRFINLFDRVNICPLGAGALAGSGFSIDREYVAKLLNFQGVYENSLDAVSDRDFIAEFLFNASLVMMHFSKLSEEIILWSSHEFSFVELDDQFCTGSSMMPQKKNPDVAELARGKVGRVYGALIGLLTVLKGLPLAYNKDLQEDKEGLFDVVKTLTKTLTVFAPLLKSMKINKERMRAAIDNDYSNATQLANYLVNKKIAFRDAHAIAGKIVMFCINKKILLRELTIEDYKTFSNYFEQDLYEVIKIENVVEAHTVSGGTSKGSVDNQINRAKDKIVDVSNWLALKMKLLEIVL